MNSPKVVTDGRISINIADLKCIKVMSEKHENFKKFFLIFEFKTRFEYIINPETQKFERTEFNDIASHEFSEYEMAVAYKSDWESMWQDYLDEKSQSNSI